MNLTRTERSRGSMNVKSVIFDMDGVIFDSERLYIDCCVEAAEQLCMENIVETCRRCIGVTSDVTENILLETYRDAALVARFRDRSVSLFLDRCRAGELGIKPGVVELLQALMSVCIPIAIASSTRTSIVESELLEAGLLDFFDVIVGGDQVQRSKPNPDIFLKAAVLLGSDPQDCVVIDDSYNGIRAAKAAGMKAVMVPDLLEPTEEMESLADAIVPSLFEVPPLLALHP